jgi:hypothetical protein
VNWAGDSMHNIFEFGDTMVPTQIDTRRDSDEDRPLTSDGGRLRVAFGIVVS